MFHPRGTGFLSQLPQITVRRLASAAEMAVGRNACRKLAVRGFLRVALRTKSGAEAVDDVFVAEHSPSPALFRLRDHSLPPDGCGHYFQARVGAHRGNGG